MLIAIFGGTLEILRDMSARKSCQVDKPLKGTFSVLFAGCCLLNVDLSFLVLESGTARAWSILKLHAEEVNAGCILE